MTPKEAEDKYGKEMFKKMNKYLIGITISLDKNGNINIPNRDLELAYKQLHGYKLSPEEWD